MWYYDGKLNIAQSYIDTILNPKEPWVRIPYLNVFLNSQKRIEFLFMFTKCPNKPGYYQVKYHHYAALCTQQVHPL